MIILKCCQLCFFCISYLFNKPLFVKIEKDVSNYLSAKKTYFFPERLIFTYFWTTTFLQNHLKKTSFRRYVDILGYMAKKRFLKVIMRKRPFSRNVDIFGHGLKSTFSKWRNFCRNLDIYVYLDKKRIF